MEVYNCHGYTNYDLMPDKQTFSVPAQLTRCASLADHSLSLGFHTKEISNVEKAMIMDHQNLAGWLIFSTNKLQDEDIPKQDADLEEKTPSQRLRAVLFILWKQKGEQGDFNTFYRETLEHIISVYKGKLL